MATATATTISMARATAMAFVVINVVPHHINLSLSTLLNSIIILYHPLLLSPLPLFTLSPPNVSFSFVNNLHGR